MERFDFSECPRCGDRSLEHLTDHCHCPNCLYSCEFTIEPPTNLVELERLLNRLERESAPLYENDEHSGGTDTAEEAV